MREIDEKSFSIINFYERRARRLFPALGFMLATTTVASIFFLIPEDLVDFSKSAVYALFFLANIFFYQNIGYFNEAAQLKPLLHTWSLGIEEQFYLIFPFFMLIFYTRVSKTVFMIILGTVVAISFASGLFLSGTSAGFYLPVTRMWELGIGSLLALTYGSISIRNKRIADSIGALGLAMIVFIYARADSNDPWPGLLALISCLGAAAVIISGSNSQSLTSRVLASSPLVGIGRISYSLYLWHWPVIVFANYGRFEETPLYGKALLVSISFLLAYLSWRWVEEPMRKKPWLILRSSLYKLVLTPLAATLCVLIILIHFDGLPDRVNDEDRARWTASLSENNYRHSHCHHVTVERVQIQDLCVRGHDDSAPTFVLVGDSHANSISPAVFEAATQLGLAGYQFTGPGFSPTVGRARIGNIRRQQIFDERNDAFLEFLSDKPHIKTIYITGWWHRYATGISYREGDAIWQDEDCNSHLGLKCNMSSLKRSLSRLVKKFPDRSFIFLDDVPTGWALHPNSYYRASFRGLLENQAAILSIDQARKQFDSYAPLLTALADGNSNTFFMPFIFDRICEDSGCPIHTEEGDLIFIDGDHLSITGAMMLADEMLKVMRTREVLQ